MNSWADGRTGRQT